MSSGERWHISNDSYDFDYCPYGSMDDAIEAGKDEYGDEFWVGREVRFKPQIDEEKVIDDLRDQAYDFADEYADDWLLSIAEKDVERLRYMLQRAFKLWMFETGNVPSFFVIVDTRHVVNGEVVNG